MKSAPALRREIGLPKTHRYKQYELTKVAAWGNPLLPTGRRKLKKFLVPVAGQAWRIADACP